MHNGFFGCRVGQTIKVKIIFFSTFILLFVTLPVYPQKNQSSVRMIAANVDYQNITQPSFQYDGFAYQLYPQRLKTVPQIPSPLVTEAGIEVVLAKMKNNQCALIPVTVENGRPLLYSYHIKDLFGKDKQLRVDTGDFLTLAQTGLHSESEFEKKKMITGFPVSLITYIGHPGRFSPAGFLAADEDINTVLKCDNRQVNNLGLTHPQMARPLFHVWNVILKEIELGYWVRFWDNISSINYNNREVAITAEAGKGWQISIFQDEIKGRFSIHLECALSEYEELFLRKRYSQMSVAQFSDMIFKLTHIHFSEMAPYYIMRYGFYEGHTEWRAESIAIASVFGLRSIEEIESTFEENLYKNLTDHFTKSE